MTDGHILLNCQKLLFCSFFAFTVCAVDFFVCCSFRCGKSKGGESSPEGLSAVQNMHGQKYLDVVFTVQSSRLLRWLCPDPPWMPDLSSCNPRNCPDIHIVNIYIVHTTTLYIVLSVNCILYKRVCMFLTIMTLFIVSDVFYFMHKTS